MWALEHLPDHLDHHLDGPPRLGGLAAEEQNALTYFVFSSTYNATRSIFIVGPSESFQLRLVAVYFPGCLPTESIEV